MLGHLRRRETQPAGANPWRPLGYGRRGHICCVAPPRLCLGMACVGSPCICTYGARNAARGTFTMMRWTPPLGLDGI